jgi:spore coat protein U-like protein
MKRFSIIGILALVVGTSPCAGAAATHQHTASLQVRGSVNSNCSLTTFAINFTVAAAYVHSKNNAAVLQQSSLGVKCTKGAVTQISMDAGLYGNKAGAQFGARSMKSNPGKSYLGYDLCHDSACASLWTPTAYSYTSPTDAGSSLPVWARIKTGQQVDAGSYSDSVTVTVNF